MRALVVLPTYNEAAGIEKVLLAIRSSLPEAVILVVDDSSPDGTAAIADRVALNVGGIVLMRRTGKQGLGSAYRSGFMWGLDHGFDICVEMDADMSHDPADLPRLIAPISDGCDLVIGSRYVPGGTIPDWSWHRRVLSRGGNAYSALMLGLAVKDSTSGFRAYSSELLASMDLNAVRAEGYGFQIEMTRAARNAGAGIVEIPIAFTDRVEGESKMSYRIVLEALGLVSVWGIERAARSLVAGRTARARRPGGAPGESPPVRPRASL